MCCNHAGEATLQQTFQGSSLHITLLPAWRPPCWREPPPAAFSGWRPQSPPPPASPSPGPGNAGRPYSAWPAARRLVKATMEAGTAGCDGESGGASPDDGKLGSDFAPLLDFGKGILLLTQLAQKVACLQQRALLQVVCSRQGSSARHCPLRISCAPPGQTSVAPISSAPRLVLSTTAFLNLLSHSSYSSSL